MKIAKVSTLKGGEVVAENITFENGMILIPKNTVLKKEYIQSMIEIGIDTIYIKKNSYIKMQEGLFFEINNREKLKKIIQETLEEHTYKKVLKLESLVFVANEIIKEIEGKVKDENIKIDIIEHNGDLYEHTFQVCMLTVSVAIKMGLEKNKVYGIALASLLHDIGLRYITINYKNCDIDNLTPNEIFEYRKHTIYGYIALEDFIEINSFIKNLVLFHHEKLDGTGFPLKQKKLDKFQRILAVCDAFECSISGIGCIRKSKKETMILLESASGSSYDKEVIYMIKRMINIS